MFGFFNVNKPYGPTSHDIVARVRRRLPRDIKVGHAGTLDPFADGVLVLCVGPATRLAENVQAGQKTYRASFTLGATSTTDDPEGEITPSPLGGAPPGREEIERVLGSFVGVIEQRPPAYSAVHVQGRRAYELARTKQTVCLAPRHVETHDIRLLEFSYPMLRLEVRCAAGTYIRSLARDVGEALGVGGYCSALTRTAVGPFQIEAAVTPNDLDPDRDLLPPQMGLNMPCLTIDDSAAGEIRHGRAIPNPSLPAGTDLFGLTDSAGRLIALAAPSDDGRLILPKKVFPLGKE